MSETTASAGSPSSETSVAPASRPADTLLPLGGRRRLRALVTVLVLAAAAAWGTASLVLQGRYTDDLRAGRSLGSIAQVLADGSGPRTAWPGWLAAFLFAVSTLRLLRGRPEAPAGRPAGTDWTVGEIRGALRREYRWVRAALAAVTVIAVLDAVRAAIFAGASLAGSHTASSTLSGVLVEAGGLCAAALVLAGWTAGFRRRLRSWGAL